MIYIKQNKRYNECSMVDYNLTELDHLSKKGEYIPTYKMLERDFSTTNDIRVYVKKGGGVPAHVMVDRMCCALFAGISSCSIYDRKGVVVMFCKLLSGWVTSLHSVGVELTKGDPSEIDSVISERMVHFEQLLSASSGDRVKSMVKAEFATFRERYRTRLEIEILVSRHVFRTAATYYNIPYGHSVDIQDKYRSLRNDIISEWCTIVSGGCIPMVRPEVIFTPVTPFSLMGNLFRESVLGSNEKIKETTNKLSTHCIAYYKYATDAGFGPSAKSDCSAVMKYYLVLVERDHKLRKSMHKAIMAKFQ